MSITVHRKSMTAITSEQKTREVHRPNERHPKSGQPAFSVQKHQTQQRQYVTELG